MYRLVLNGAGVSVLPSFLMARETARGWLVRLLPDWHLPQGGIYALYPSVRYVPVWVRALIESLRGYLGRESFRLAQGE